MNLLTAFACFAACVAISLASDIMLLPQIYILRNLY